MVVVGCSVVAMRMKPDSRPAGPAASGRPGRGLLRVAQVSRKASVPSPCRSSAALAASMPAASTKLASSLKLSRTTRARKPRATHFVLDDQHADGHGVRFLAGRFGRWVSKFRIIGAGTGERHPIPGSGLSPRMRGCAGQGTYNRPPMENTWWLMMMDTLRRAACAGRGLPKLRRGRCGRARAECQRRHLPTRCPCTGRCRFLVGR